MLVADRVMSVKWSTANDWNLKVLACLLAKFWYNQDPMLWQHSQVVRQRSAKPPSPSSNLGAAFNRNLAYSEVFVFLPINSSPTDYSHRQPLRYLLGCIQFLNVVDL
jgi:hypothetical protein